MHTGLLKKVGKPTSLPDSRKCTFETHHHHHHNIPVLVTIMDNTCTAMWKLLCTLKSHRVKGKVMNFWRTDTNVLLLQVFNFHAGICAYVFLKELLPTTNLGILCDRLSFHGKLLAWRPDLYGGTVTIAESKPWTSDVRCSDREFQVIVNKLKDGGNHLSIHTSDVAQVMAVLSPRVRFVSVLHETHVNITIAH